MIRCPRQWNRKFVDEQPLGLSHPDRDPRHLAEDETAPIVFVRSEDFEPVDDLDRLGRR